MFSDFDEDPFFRNYHKRFHDARNFSNVDKSLAQFDEGFFESPFKEMNKMIKSFNSGGMIKGKPSDGQSYSYSSVVSYQNDGNGPPQYYEASSSTRQAGKLKETRKTLRDSYSGEHKMGMGQYIGSRGHFMERSKNSLTGETNQNREYYEIDERNYPQFADEWRTEARKFSKQGLNKLPDRKENRKSLKY